jgi:hypothetical protein
MESNLQVQSKSAKFVEWMLRNKNIHTANMQAMDRAIRIVEQQDNGER